MNFDPVQLAMKAMAAVHNTVLQPSQETPQQTTHQEETPPSQHRGPRSLYEHVVQKAELSHQIIQTPTAQPHIHISQPRRKVSPADSGIFLKHIRTDMPPDGWSALEFRKYISTNWSRVTGKFNQSAAQYENNKVTTLIDTAHTTFNMCNSECVAMIDWYFESYAREEQTIPYWHIEKSLQGYYNLHISQWQQEDGTDEYLNCIPRRGLIISGGAAIREEIARYIKGHRGKDSKGKDAFFVESIDPRIIVQLGFEVVFKWLSKQSSNTSEEILTIMRDSTEALRQSDLIGASNFNGYSGRLAMAFRNTIAFEPYPWNTQTLPDWVDIRSGSLFKLANDLEFTQATWWKKVPLKADKTIPSCLKKITQKSKSLPRIVEYSA